MKVRLLTAATQWGGLEGHTVALASTLEARGHDVAIVEFGRDVFARRKAARGGRTEVVHVPLNGADGLDASLRDMSFLAWWRMLKPLQGDVGVFAKGDYEGGSWRLDLAARLCFRRYITIEHSAMPMPQRASRRHFGSLPGFGLWWHRLRMKRRLRSPWPHAVVCVSDAVRAPLAQDYGFASHKLVTVHNGIDPDVFRPDPHRRQAMRDSWRISADALVFGCVGRLDSRKACEIAVEGLRELVRDHPGRDLRLVLAGEGPSRADLERLVREKGLNDFVVFAGFTERPQDVYPGLDVFLLPSTTEGLPLALLEAMACQCCPIAMSVGGVREILANPSLGWLVQPGDRHGFAAAMKAASLASRAERSGMGTRGRERVVSDFDARLQFAALADVIETSAGSARRSRKPHDPALASADLRDS